MVRMQVASHITERQHLMRPLFDLPRTEHTRGVTVEQQRHQHFRRIGLATLCTIPLIDCRQVELCHYIHHEPRQMLSP